MKDKRVVHYITKNANRQIPHHILVVDTETWINKLGEFSEHQTFRLGYAIYLRWNGKEYTERHHPLHSVEDFHDLLDVLLMLKRKLIILSHNSSFDYAILKMDSYLSSRHFTISLRVIDQIFLIRAFKRYKKGFCSLVYGDTMNYYKMPLSKLGEIFGEKKMKIPDFTKVSDEKLMEYCKQDTQVLATLMKKHIDFILKNNLGNFKLTIASQAFNAFRHRFMDVKILVHNFPDVIEMEMMSYRGGRCEAFIIGKRKNVYKLDVNSMYPFVMKSFEYPIKPLTKYPLEDMNIDDIIYGNKNGSYCLAECDIKLNEPAVAVKKDKLYFPIGNVRQILTMPELMYIIDNPEVGEIIDVRKAVFYDQSKIFVNYVNFFYGYRQSTTNLAYQAMAKLFLNSLYGKFGQKSHNSHILVTDNDVKERITDIMDNVGTNSLHELNDGKAHKFIRLGNDLYFIEEPTDILSQDSSPVIASTVTAYSRRYLFEIMKIAGLENVYYSDTDSVFVNEDGYENIERKGMLSVNELGMLKVEEKGNVEIFGAKNYKFNESVKLKGVKKDAKKIGENTYMQSQFMTKNMKYRKGIEDGLVVVQPIIKEISEEYTKGNVVDGIVYPFIFEDF